MFRHACQNMEKYPLFSTSEQRVFLGRLFCGFTVIDTAMHIVLNWSSNQFLAPLLNFR